VYFDDAAPNVERNFEDDDARDIWAEAARQADEFIGITAAAIRDLWNDEHPQVSGDEAAAVRFALDGEPSTRREEVREELTRAFIGGPVKRILAIHTRAHDAEDVRQSALEGLWRGFNAFDPSRHRRPVATIEREVLAALDTIHAARVAMRVPEATRLKFARCIAAYPDDVETAAEHADEFDFTPGEFWHVYRVWHTQPLSAAFTSEPGDSREGAALPLWESAAPNVEHEPVVAALLDGLAGREREVIALRFGLDGKPAHTEDEAAAVVGLTPRRVRQIQAAALTKLRATLGVEVEGAAE
jgi:DNA-directed RNA polymerase specialized sigma subunit